MSTKHRRNFSASFKAKVALEALQERLTLSDLAAKYDLHPNQISDWKKQLLAHSEDVFAKGSKVSKEPDIEQQKEELYKVVGQLKVENDWLKKKSEHVFGKNWKNEIDR